MKIAGRISRLFPDSFLHSLTDEEIEFMLLGKPIKDYTGAEIGVIMGVVPSDDVYYGWLNNTSSIYDIDPCCTSSIELKIDCKGA